MLLVLPAVLQDVGDVTAGILQRVGKNRQAVEGAPVVNAPRNATRRIVVPGEPATVNSDRAERVAKDVVK
jgi:hypothetical protein